MSFVRLGKKVLVRGATAPSTSQSTNDNQGETRNEHGPSQTIASQATKDELSEAPVSLTEKIKPSIAPSRPTVTILGKSSGGGLGLDQKIPGTRNWINNVVLTSTGLPQLDTIMGGGIPVGSLLAVVPDDSTSFHELFSQ